MHAMCKVWPRSHCGRAPGPFDVVAPGPRMREMILATRAIWDGWNNETKLDFLHPGAVQTPRPLRLIAPATAALVE